MSVRPLRAGAACGGVSSRGYTLVEVLVAVTLTLILLTSVVKVFSGVGDGISKSRKTLEAFDRLRLAENVLRQDLQGITVTMMPPWRPEEAKGYFEYIEGGYSDPPARVLDPTDYRFKNINVNNNLDSTIGQRGDILMFTTRAISRPFVGRYDSGDPAFQTVQSDVAEVAWFLRGRTLHRRVLLVTPGLTPKISGYSPNTFYLRNDISVHRANGQFVANSLADLARRENRYAHPTKDFPFDVRWWWPLGLPTMRECADTEATKVPPPTPLGGLMDCYNWTSGSFPDLTSPKPGTTAKSPTMPMTSAMMPQVDLWQNFCLSGTNTYWLPDWYLMPPKPPAPPNPPGFTASPPRNSSRDGDDIILTNVIGFDVKVWDPGDNTHVGAYVDLGDAQNGTQSHFGGLGATNNLLPPYKAYPMSSIGTGPLQREFDTFPQNFETEGLYHFSNGNLTFYGSSQGGQSSNGFDDSPNQSMGMVDSPADQLTSPPYPVPLRGIQIRIRIFEPSSRQIKEVTIEHDFLPK